MRLLASVIMVMAMILPARANQPPTADFVQLETAWNAAHLASDAEALDRLWADDLEVAVPGMAPMSKGESLAFVRTGRMRFDRYETSQIKVRQYADSAVVTGRLQRTRTVEGRQREDEWRFTKVYVRTAAGWRVVSFHASDSPPPR